MQYNYTAVKESGFFAVFESLRRSLFSQGEARLVRVSVRFSLLELIFPIMTGILYIIPYIFLLFFYSKTQWDASGPSHSLSRFIRKYYAAVGKTPTAVTKTNELPGHYPQGCAAFAWRPFRRRSLGGALVRRAAGETGRVVTANISLRLIIIITHRRLDTMTAQRNLLAAAAAMGASEQDFRKRKLKLSSPEANVWVQSDR